MTLTDTATAALEAGVTPRTVRRWAAEGRLVNHSPRADRVLVNPAEAAQLAALLTPRRPRRVGNAAWQPKPNRDHTVRNIS